MSKPVYMLSVFYEDAKKQSSNLAKFQPTIRSVSNADMVTVEYDKHQVGYFFTSELTHKELREKLAGLCAEKIHILIVQVQAFVATNISVAAIQWLQVHQVEIQK